jgi:predicted ATP-grasp superfamily ATP-dependent carboligase
MYFHFMKNDVLFYLYPISKLEELFMNILILNNWHEGMQFFYNEHIDHAIHDVWYLCDEEGKRGLENALPSGKYRGLTEISDIQSKDEMLSAVENIFKNFKFEKIVALDELTVLSAAIIRDHYDIGGPREREVLHYRDKKLMKKALEASNVKTIQPIDINRLSESNFVPCVIKPSNQAGAQGVKICENYEDFLAAKTQTELDLVEEYVSGQIYYVDGVYNEHGVVCIANRYIGNCYDHFNNQIPLGGVSIDDETLTKRIQIITEEITNKLPLRQGIFHLELIHSLDDELVFLEIACRIGGCSYDVPNDVYGIDLIKYHILTDLGEPWSLPKRITNIHSGMLMLNSFPSSERYYLGFKSGPLSENNRMYKTSFPLFGRKMNSYDGTVFCFKSVSASEVELSINEIIQNFEFI